MANTDVAKGLVPVKYLNGTPYNGKCGKYYIPATDSTAVYIGDPVKLAGSADARGIPTVAKASSTEVFVGVVVGVEPETADSTRYRAASTGRYVFVADDPDLLFEIQEDSDGGALAATDVGLNANFIDGGGSTTTAFSGLEIDSSTAATTATLDFQIVRLADREDNVIGNYAKWLVKLNNHQFVDGTTGIS
jgi:hypothetical protein